MAMNHTLGYSHTHEVCQIYWCFYLIKILIIHIYNCVVDAPSCIFSSTWHKMTGGNHCLWLWRIVSMCLCTTNSFSSKIQIISSHTFKFFLQIYHTFIYYLYIYIKKKTIQFVHFSCSNFSQFYFYIKMIFNKIL